MKKKPVLSCADCSVGNCNNLSSSFPSFCLTENTDSKVIGAATAKYLKNKENNKMSLTAARLESEFYCKLTRVEEVLLFIIRMGYKKVGVATCVGLLSECRTFAKIAKAKGVELYGVACKVGAVDKTVVGLDEEEKIRPHNHESICNPILQAEILNQAKTEFNIVVGLCVGHDTLFIKHSKAPVTYLVVKDRVLCHNPAAALYTSNFYYKKLLAPFPS